MACAHAQASSLHFEGLATEDGLSQNHVTSITADPDGYLWFGTRDGLNRYDGYRFKVFRPDNQNKTSLADATVNALLVDTSQRLWIGTDQGLNRYRPETQSFDRHRHVCGSTTITTSGDRVKSILADGQNGLWLGTAAGLCHFEIDRNTYSRLSPAVDSGLNLASESIQSLLLDRSGWLWVGTNNNGLLRCNRGVTSCHHYRHDPKQQRSLANNFIFALHEDHGGTLWVGTLGGGLDRYHRESDDFSHFGSPSQGSGENLKTNNIRSILEIAPQRLWLGTDDGLFDLNTQTGARQQYRHQEHNRQSLASNNVHSMFRDAYGVVWVGTLDKGVSKHGTHTEAFQVYRNSPDDDTSISGNNVYSIYEDRQHRLWIGTFDGGLNLLDREHHRFRHFKHEPKTNTSLSNNSVISLSEDSDGRLLVGTYGGGLNRRLAETARFELLQHERHAPLDMRTNSIYRIFRASDGRFWLGSNNAGLYRSDAKLSSFTRILAQPNKPTALSQNTVDAFHERRDGKLWLGSYGGGLNIYDPQTERFQVLRHDEKDPHSLAHDKVFDFHEDKLGQVWLATGDGLDRYDDKSRRFTHFHPPSRHGSGKILTILPGEDGELWLGTASGLLRFTPETGQFMYFGLSDGLPGEEFNMGAAWKDHTGTLNFGTTAGLVSFRPRDLQPNKLPPRLAITDIRLSNQSVLGTATHTRVLGNAAVETAQELHLNYTDTVLGIEFSALHYADPQSNRYAYRLAGVNSDWVYTGANGGSVTYTTLPSGEYLFEVNAANKDGVWSEPARRLKLSVAPPPWRTWWAYGLYALGLIGSLVLFYRLRTARLRRYTLALESQVQARTAELAGRARESEMHKQVIEGQAQRLASLLEQKNALFANVTHEFKTPLTLIHGPAQHLLAGTLQEPARQGLELIVRNAERLNRLVGQLLALARLQHHPGEQGAWRDVRATYTQLMSSFRVAAELKELTFRYTDFPAVEVFCSVDAFECILSNLLSNAIKYTPSGGQIRLDIQSQEGRLDIVLSDTGIGIPQDQLDHVFRRFFRTTHAAVESPGTGLGLALVKELLESFGGNIRLSSAPGTGTLALASLQARACASKEPPAPAITDSLAFSPHSHGPEEFPSALPKEPEAGRDQAITQRILVVDDHDDLRQFIYDSLASRYLCHAVADAEACLGYLDNQTADLIISDVMMPGIDGFTLLRELKSREHTSHIPVILLTALEGSETRTRAWEERADGYLNKPFDRSELHALLGAAFERLRHRKHQCASLLTSDRIDATPLVEDELGKRDRLLLDKMRQAFSEHYHRSEFGVAELSNELAMSDRNLQRKIKALTGQLPSEALKTYRLEKSLELLRRKHPVQQVALDVGFNSHAYFSTAFKKHYGHTPSEFLSKNTAKERIALAQP